jgi:hypothetical protein
MDGFEIYMGRRTPFAGLFFIKDAARPETVQHFVSCSRAAAKTKNIYITL